MPAVQHLQLTAWCMYTCAVQVASLAPKIDALEALWNRVRTISGADTPEDVLAYWNSELRLGSAGLEAQCGAAERSTIHLCGCTSSAACARLCLSKDSC